MSAKNTYHTMGLMSGTSLDGLDMVYAEFSHEKEGWQFKIHNTLSIAYDDTWRSKLKSAFDLPSAELDDLHMEYGDWLGKQVTEFISQDQLNVELIASHGHTVFHEPDKGITVQIGNGQAIADITGITTISDFRTGDVALGGQGAPLVPIGDELLFGDFLACLNLGGIANVSFRKGNQRLAFDIGLANMPLNELAGQLGLQYDENGDIAKSGDVNHDLLSALNGLDYFSLQGPKSLGMEWFIKEVEPLLKSTSIKVEDKLSTLVEHEAFQIGRSIEEIEGSGEVLVTGGGAYNNYLIQRVKSYLSKDKKLIIPDHQLIDSKEALIFAFMGVLRQRNEVNCLKSVTGASKDSSAGVINTPKAN